MFAYNAETRGANFSIFPCMIRVRTYITRFPSNGIDGLIPM